MNHSLIFNINGERSIFPRNLGAHRIASWLRSNEWDVEVIDYALVWSYDELVAFAKSRINNNTKFIGFSTIFEKWNTTLYKFVVWLNTYHPDIILISGSMMLPNIEDPVDYHIRGFGEKALDLLLKYLFSNGLKPATSKFGNIDVIDASKYPAYPMEDYAVYYEERDFLQPWEFLSIETARGCVFQCTFCNHPVLGVKSDHTTSAESFQRQLEENYSRWGIKNYVISDETFNDQTNKIKKFANVVNKLNFTPWISAYIRIDLLLSRPDDKKYLEDMNLFGQYYGIESFNHKTAKAFKKGMHPDKIKNGLLEIKEYYAKSQKYRGTVSLIVGGPHEDKESIESSMLWLIDNWNDQAVMQFPLIIPTGEQVRPSELTKNYNKYGYEGYPIKYFEDKYPDEKDLIYKLKKYTPMIYWKNEYMDIIQATNIQQKNSQRLVDAGFKIQSNDLSRFSKKFATIEEKLKLGVRDMDDDPSMGEWHKEYINKKLDWVQ